MDINLIEAVVVQVTLTKPGISLKTSRCQALQQRHVIRKSIQYFQLLRRRLPWHQPNLTFQTYSPFDFQTNGIFQNADDTVIISHEAAEWMNDPYDVNPTPVWGNTGQVVGCQNNLEVGDPLTGTNASPIVGKNGFAYHLRELAFYSWFYEAPSVGIHGWFSNNATFRTDAEPPCT